MLDKIKKMIKGNDNLKDIKPINDRVQETKVQLQEAVVTETASDEYLQYSAEAVGFSTREDQWNLYKATLQYIPEASSILDFGCGRGDLHVMHLSEYGELDYIGIDMNEPLINAGKIVDPNRDIRLFDWFNLPLNITKDWCVNIGSSNLRYDADMKRSDFEYTCDTIEKMYKHAIKGIVVLLTSKNVKEDGIIQHDPGKILNWAQDKFKNVLLDHSSSEDGFCLIIKK
tara:strand:+ start:7110 stop:7793 length:684 start_codon:yes stop_codon:yes gene_type:complete